MLIESAILETLAYSDIYDYPLDIDELQRYLIVPASRDQVARHVAQMKMVGSRDGYYFLSGRDAVVALRRQRASESQRTFKWAMFHGQILGSLPFVCMVALTGSLAVRNPSNGADMDYMLVTRAGSLWMARAMAVSYGRLMRLFGHRICVNLLVSERALTWPMRDLYSARELCQMIPVAGLDVYHELRAANLWTNDILPNCADPIPGPSLSSQTWMRWLQRLVEFPLRGRIGDRLETWAEKYQRNRLARKYGQGNETNFSADVCQANFHNHRRQADESLQARLASLGLAEPAEKLMDVPVVS